MALCEGCGTHSDSLDRFCGECGAPLAGDVTDEEIAQEQIRRGQAVMRKRFMRLAAVFVVCFIWCGVWVGLGSAGVVPDMFAMIMFLSAFAVLAVMFVVTFAAITIANVKLVRQMREQQRKEK